MAISLEAFLKARRFISHPFSTTNAEQERDRLASYFVHVSWFDQLVGDPRQPESLILFAPRGHGKTSHRLEVARLAGRRRDAPALVIPFTEFDLLASAATLDIASYLPIICRATLQGLADLLYEHPERERLLQRDPLIHARFGALLQLYMPLRAIGLDFPPAPTQELLTAFRSTQLGATAWLKELSSLAQQAGLASVYFLIDGVDEQSATSDQPQAALQLLKPLLDAPALLQECGFAFKFFLPDLLEAPMREQGIGRIDRLPIYHLAWNDVDLQAMLSKRLTRFSLVSPTSRIGAVHLFKDLCERDVDGDAQLVKAANASPRRLIDLARQVIHEHCQRVDDPLAPIGASTFARVLAEQMPVRAAPAPTLIATESAALYFDSRGDVWLGAERRTARPLPKLLRRCMEYLWANRHRTVHYHELQQALYGDTLMERGDPRTSCDKIVRRLRLILEPGKQHSQTYIAVQPGTGYVLSNYREPPADTM
jgi:hypothetical protein